MVLGQVHSSYGSSFIYFSCVMNATWLFYSSINFSFYCLSMGDAMPVGRRKKALQRGTGEGCSWCDLFTQHLLRWSLFPLHSSSWSSRCFYHVYATPGCRGPILHLWLRQALGNPVWLYKTDLPWQGASQVVLVVKNPPVNPVRHKRCRFDPWVSKMSWRRAWQPTPVFLPGESRGQRGLEGYSPWGCKELDTTEVT